MTQDLLRNTVISLLSLSLIISVSGCSILNHLEELSTLGEYSREKDEQHKMVRDINAHYEALLVAINTGKMKQYPDKSSLRRNFGEPIEIKIINVAGTKQEQWLYRQAIAMKAKDRVYLYFDGQGQLIKFQQEQIQW